MVDRKSPPQWPSLTRWSAARVAVTLGRAPSMTVMVGSLISELRKRPARHHGALPATRSTASSGRPLGSGW